MSNYATINLVNDLARLPGVGNVNVFGASNYAMRIWLDPNKLYSLRAGAEGCHQRRAPAKPGGRRPARSACRRRRRIRHFQYTIDIQSRMNDAGAVR